MNRSVFSAQFSLSTFALLVALLLNCLFATPALQAADVEFTQSFEQAKSLAKKKVYHEAVQELRRALRTTEGERSFEAQLLLGQWCLKTLDIACSFEGADKALTLALTADQKSLAGDFLQYLRVSFGKVEFRAGEGQLTQGYLVLEPQESIMDEDARAYYEKKVTVLAETKVTVSPSPWIMYLPAITYRLHGQEFTVVGGEEMVVFAGFTLENSTPPAPPEPVTFSVRTEVSLATVVPLPVSGAAEQLRPGVVLVGSPVRYGRSQLALETPVLLGVNLTSFWAGLPQLAAGVAAGGDINPSIGKLHWSAGFMAGLGGFTTWCGPARGVPEETILTCGAPDGFPAAIKAAWVGPVVSLGFGEIQLGGEATVAELGFSVLAIGQAYAASGGRTLQVEASDGETYDIPYRFDGEHYRGFVPVVIPGVSLEW